MSAAERLAVDLQRPGLDPGRRTVSGTCTCSPRSSRTSTGATPRWSRSSTTSSGSGWTAASTGSGSTAPPCCSRIWTASRSRTPTTTRCTTSTAAGGGSPTRTTTGSWSARCGCRTRNGSRCTCGRTRCTPRSTSTSCPARGKPTNCEASIDLTLTTHVPIGAPPTWVLSNHDVTRPVTKYGRPDTSFSHQDRKHGMRDRPRPRRTPGPRRRAARDGAARRPVRLPGRGTRPARGRGPPGRPAPGPDLDPLRRHRPRPRWLPCPPTVVRQGAPVRLRHRYAVAAATRRLEEPHRRVPARRPELDARPSTAPA